MLGCAEELGQWYIGSQWGQDPECVYCFSALRLFCAKSGLNQSTVLDLPGIIEGAKDGKGRGRQVIAGSSWFG